MAALIWAVVSLCGENKVCRIIERCRGNNDCSVGTICLAPEDLPQNTANYTCPYDDPVIRELEGTPIREIQCDFMTRCPVGTSCVEPGVCCTGQSKETGVCPPVKGKYFMTKGSCSTFCRHDQECSGFQRCCDTGIGCKTCMDTLPIITCETQMCAPGSHCVMMEKECVTYPCHASPSCVLDKPGTCPMQQDKFTTCVDQCLVDSHCPTDLKCCGSGKCRVCVPPTMDSGLNFNNDATLFTNPGTTDTPKETGTNSGFGGMSSFLGTGFPTGGAGTGLTNEQASSTASPTTNPFNTGNSTFDGALAMVKAMQDRAAASSQTSSTGPTATPLQTMMNKVRLMMNKMKSGQNSLDTVNMNTMTNPFSNMMSTMMNTAKTSSPLGGSFSSMNSLSPLGSFSNNPLTGTNTLSTGGLGGGLSGGLGGLGGGGGGLDAGFGSRQNPIMSSNTLQTLSGGSHGNIARDGAGLSSSGLNPLFPSLGGGRGSPNARRQSQRPKFKCDMMCMMMLMMPS